MKSVPSLVASSTVGVAATGLVFGQPQTSQPGRPASNKRKATEYDGQHRSFSSPLARPKSASFFSTPSPRHVSASSPIRPLTGAEYRFGDLPHIPVDTAMDYPRRTGSITRFGESLPIDSRGEDHKDSLSSRGSWMRKISHVPPSQHGSPRSSVGPDSPSLTISHTSNAPILRRNASPSQPEPNKLVKRATSMRGANGASSRPSSSQRIPTLRRPATSHQRSVTLQQQFKEDAAKSQSAPSYLEELPVTIVHELSPTPRRSFWRPYFESRPTRLAKERLPTLDTDTVMDGFYSTSKTVTLGGSVPPTLMKPWMIDNLVDCDEGHESPVIAAVVTNEFAESDSAMHLGNDQSHKRSRQSAPLHFSSPITWINRSGSLHVPKSRRSGSTNNSRNISAPGLSTPVRAAASHGGQSYKRADIMDPSIYHLENDGHDFPNQPQTQFSPSQAQDTARNVSSPLPTISRLSSFNLDLSVLGALSPTVPQHKTSTSPISVDNVSPLSRSASDARFRALSSHPVVVHQNGFRRHSELNVSDRGSTLVGSDVDGKGFASGEDDEMDFQSDTAYDSYRTDATTSLRARNTPLDSMFDESPPSSGTRSKMSELHEMALLSAFRNADDRIVEEDEGMTTPIKTRRRYNEDMYDSPIRQGTETAMNDVIPSSPPSYCLAAKNFSRLSLGDDEDDEEDWTRDDDSIALSNPLSPPSSSINSQRISKALRTALADTTEVDAPIHDDTQMEEAPRNVFDWSDPVHHETDIMGHLPRPSTVHGKQSMESRGGRGVGRHRPSVLHVRSQSVPVVPDVAGNREPKLTPKFGTWGLGAKGVSEDWDNDFDFESMDIDEENGESSFNKNAAMHVPPAIQASQANVVGHVGQIREVCLLVEDLKRLRGLAREKGIINGPSADKWREAEGIIALAIPDEEEDSLSPPQSPLGISHDRSSNLDQRASNHNERSNVCKSDNGHADQNLPNELQSSLVMPRRQSIFASEDDIFGTGLPHNSDEEAQTTKNLRRQPASRDTTEVARSVMENMHQHRSTSDPILSTVTNQTTNKMPFDTTSLRDLVQRANALTRALSEIIRKADGIKQSPRRTSIAERDSSPAFTRVFTDPLASPSKNMHRTQSNNSVLSANIDSSPTRNLGQRMQLMTVV